jgi:NiFe hydrogenase small subunit HydA
VDVTFAEAVKDLAAHAAKVLCIGTCSSFGGIPAAPPNPTGVVSVKTLTGLSTINIAGCPPHPDWMIWAIVQLLQGKTIPVDANGRPTYIYGQKIHEHCPLEETDEINTFGVPLRCLKELGCRGPEAYANCYSMKWNNKVNWCIGAGAPCLNCTSPSFPGTSAFNRQP